MGCGKGGDLNKWQKARVSEYVGVGVYCPSFYSPSSYWTYVVDIAEVSVIQARSRYLASAAAHPSRVSNRFTAHFATLDCYTNPLSSDLSIPLPPKAAPFDVVSMQFCMHYAFESVQKARVMLENVTMWLRKGGRFIGTIPNDKLLL